MDDSCSTFMTKRHNPYESRNAMNLGTTIVSRARLAPQVLLWVDSLRGFPAENNSSNGGGNLKKSSKQSLGALIKKEQTVRKVTSDQDHSLCTEEEEEGEEEEEEQETSSSEEEEEELSHEYSSSADRRRGARSRSAQEEIQQARKLLKILNLEHMISEEDVFESSFQSKSRRQRSNYLNSVACKKTRRSTAAYHHAMSKKFDLDRDISCASDIDEMEEEDEESGRRAAELKEDDVNSSMPLWSAPSQSNKDSTSDQQSEPKKNQIRKDVQQTISQWRYKPLAALPNSTSQQQQQNNNNNHQLLDIIKSDTTTCQALNQQDKELLIQQDQDHYKDSSACCTPMLSYSKLLSSKNLMMVNKMKSSESAHHHTLLQLEIQKLRDSLEQQARQIGILTKSNSNLLLRIETLEREIKLLTSIQFVSSTLSSS
ncbi:unnamed protein product [Sphagnum troendelagicum]|uniref:Uncharacterized protein n=1 Tax=Sphagnum troendelagicum TaxID=128251 RepID=A0ABP0UAJ6_9BRYO